MLLGRGAVSTLATAQGGCLLHAAAASARHDVLEAALPVLARVQINLNQADALGRTPLHTAVREADERIVAQLLAAGANTEARDDDGLTPLQCAVQRGAPPVVGALLDQGADTNVLSAEGVPVLVLAAEHSPPIAFALLEAGANPNLADGVGRAALEVAVAQGAVELCEALLAKGAQPTKRKDALGNTSLHTAVALGSERLVRLLLGKKAEVEQQNRRGCTPLLLASEAGQKGVVQQLLDVSAGLHLCDSSNRSALELALEHNHLETLATLLHQACVDINGITKRGSSLLHLAAELGDEERVTFLLRQHAQVDVLNPNGETPLHWACSLGHLNAVRCLVQAGASAMLHERVQGMTPLHAACGGRSQPAVLALLIQRCEYMQWNGNPQRANLLDAAKNTPLHTSTKLAPQPLKNFPILLEHGANPNLQNVQGQSVLHLLAERAVRQQQLASTQLADGAPGAGAPPPELPMARMLDMLSEACTLQLDAQEAESGNTPLHIAAFGGCIEMAQQLVCLGASVGLPNRDGFTALDSMQPTGTGRSLQSLLLAKVAKPPSWTPDRLVNNCQQCKLPFNRADPNMARKHHCRHCGRCVCSLCSARRMPIPKFGSTQDERVCLLCERVLASASAGQLP
jgi:ankyrin repeat protein